MVEFLCLVIAAPSVAAEPGHSVRFSGLKPGCRLALFITNPGVVPQDLVIHLYGGKSPTPSVVDSLNGLAGKVVISTPRSALDFVRLRTSRSTWDLGWHGDLEVEVMGLTEARHAANYGIIPDSLPPEFEGWLGVLSDRHFHRRHFAAARVASDPYGFTVARTLFVESSKGQFLEICREHVGRDGAYRRKVTRVSPVPKGNEFTWYFPKKE